MTETLPGNVTVIDSGVSNLGSILNMCEHLGIRADVASSPADILKADRLILPGVGSFDRGMESLDERGLSAAITEAVRELDIPILGICLGMQLLCRESEEGERSGLGLVEARSIRFRIDDKSPLKVPHMGWKHLSIQRRLFWELDESPRFYFVHSYHVVCDRTEDIVASASHGKAFCAVFAVNKIIGMQFHPEKSHRFGMHVMKSFATY